MEIRLDQITDQSFRWQETRTLSVEDLKRAQLIELSEIDWSGEVVRNTEGHLLTARVEYEQVLECPRCLGRSEMPVKFEVDFLILSRSDEPMTSEVELEESDLNVIFVEGEVLETEPVLIEQIQLNVPMRRLCRDQCRGLCPNCGADRNLEQCECSSETVDPRWQALASMRDQLGN